MSDPIAEFLARLAESGSALLVLDYDGTIAPYHDHKDQALLVPGVEERLVAIHESRHTRIVINTGRATENLLFIAALPFHVEVWGCHGREHLSAEGLFQVHGLTRGHLHGLEIGRQRLRGRIPARCIELRNGCLTVFYQDAPPEGRREMLATAHECWDDLLTPHDLRVEEFFGGVELITNGRDKGDAMKAILESVDPERVPVAFLGDAETDEDGFRAMAGRGLSILVSPEEAPRTSAQVHVHQWQGVIAFLDQWLEAIKAR